MNNISCSMRGWFTFVSSWLEKQYGDSNFLLWMCVRMYCKWYVIGVYNKDRSHWFYSFLWCVYSFRRISVMNNMPCSICVICIKPGTQHFVFRRCHFNATKFLIFLILKFKLNQKSHEVKLVLKWLTKYFRLTILY